MKSPVLAGLIAAIPLAVVLVVYALIRGKALAAVFQGQSETPLPEKTLMLIMVASFVGMAVMFGVVAGLVYGWLGMPRYVYIAIGATVVFSVLAVISKQPLPWDKIVMNLAVGGVLGALIPLLTR
jgi:ABC-type transporter Mla maintaining outer membrane lipid asymmetry permease subunit MlaE